MPFTVQYEAKDSAGGSIKVNFQGEKSTAIVAGLAELQTILSHQECIACKDLNRDGKRGVRFDRRVSQGYTFYAMICNDPACKARLEFGQRKDESGGGLFAKQWDGESKQEIEHQGWTWYKREEGSGGAQQPAERPAPAHAPVRDDDIPF